MLRKPIGNCVAFEQRRRVSGFSLFEFGVVATIFAILVTVLLQRMSYYHGEVERVAVEQLIATLRSALYSKEIGLRMQNRQGEIVALAGQNPISWLEQAPANYLGEIVNSTAKNMPPGSWYFESTQHKLVYVFRGKKSFLGDAEERISFRVESTRLPTQNAKPDGTSTLDGGVALMQVDEK
ncbi:MAG: type II secretion system protein [Pseudomonadota bacterium]